MAAPFQPGGFPPPDLPDVQMPAANFQAAARQAAKGAKEGGFWAGFWEDFGNPVKALILWATAWFLRAIGSIVAFICESVITIRDQGSPVYERLLGLALKDLLGTDITTAAGVKIYGGEGHKTLVANLGQAVMTGLYGDWQHAGPGTLKPGTEAAERLMSATLGNAFEGWFWEILLQFGSLNIFDDFGNLDDRIEKAIGLQRIVSRCLRPLADTVIATPLSWKVNSVFRPTRQGTAEAIRQYLRGRWTLEKLHAEMALDGYSDEDVASLLGTHQRFLADTDVAWLIQRGVWNEDQAVQELRDSGYNEAKSRTLLALSKDQRLDTYRKQYATLAMNAAAEGQIDSTVMWTHLRASGIGEDEAKMMAKIAGLKLELRRRDLSMSDMEAAVKKGIRTVAEFRDYCLDQGYRETDARTLELLLITEVSDKKAADEAKKKLEAEREAARQAKLEEQRAKRELAEAQAKLKGVSIAQMEDLVKRGLRSMDQYRAWLEARDYAGEVITDLVELLDAEIEDAAAAARRRDEIAAEAAKKHVSIGDLERAVRLRLVSVDEYRSQLAAMGYELADRDLMAGILGRELAAADAAEKARAEAAARLAVKQISLPDVERAVRLGYRTVGQYQARLRAEGFSAEDVDTLVQLLRDEMAADDAARKRRAEVEAALAKHKLSLAQLEDAVRAGLRTLTQYRADLVREGYSDTDADLLVRLLQLELDQAAAEAAAREKAAAALAVRRVSLSDMERAVSLGVVTVQQYRAWLGRQGFAVDDADILVANVMAQLAEVRQAEAAARARAAAAAKRGVSLTDYQASVRAGLRTVAEYRVWLQSGGYSPADVEMLAGLLQAQVDQEAAARARREEVAAQTASRGLSLAQQERAVKEGLRTLEEYQAWLLEQGYDEADAAILGALLESEIARAAPQSPA